ncbi:MAG TPA: VC0807 family protein [Candidatus Limnocylindria bacterium]|jgi:hypothetical protein|nr:VC0807 family protein [Candidatus Limnocylindria bacterium]
MSENQPSPTSTPPREKRENLWLNLACNAVLPGLLLTKLSKPERLGPIWALVIALSIPVGYSIWDLIKRRKWNVISIIGFAGTLVTGALGLWKVDSFWFAVKEAAVPTVIGLAIPLSLNTSQPLVRALLYNDQVLDTSRIGTALKERQTEREFEKLLVWASWILAGSFVASAVINFFLARYLVTGAPQSPEQMAQIGKMHWVSWPAIVVPLTGLMMWTLMRLIKGIERLTGLNGDQIFHKS